MGPTNRHVQGGATGGISSTSNMPGIPIRQSMQARMEGIGNVGVSGGHLVGLTGPAIRGEGMLQFDDMGLDEYDVADERQHEIGFDRWEINPDNMTYEELLQL